MSAADRRLAGRRRARENGGVRLLGTAALAVLLACAAGDAESRSRAPLFGVFRGTLPCDGCAGVDAELSLYVPDRPGGESGAYRLQERFRGTERTADERGRWSVQLGTRHVQGTVIRLDGGAGGPRLFERTDDDTLSLLDRDGARMDASVPHALHRL